MYNVIEIERERETHTSRSTVPLAENGNDDEMKWKILQQQTEIKSQKSSEMLNAFLWQWCMEWMLQK